MICFVFSEFIFSFSSFDENSSAFNLIFSFSILISTKILSIRIDPFFSIFAKSKFLYFVTVSLCKVGFTSFCSFDS